MDRAQKLSAEPEFSRSLSVTLLISEAVAFNGPVAAELFEAAYDDAKGKKYWKSFLSEPIPVARFAYTLSAHLAKRVEMVTAVQLASEVLTVQR